MHGHHHAQAPCDHKHLFTYYDTRKRLTDILNHLPTVDAGGQHGTALLLVVYHLGLAALRLQEAQVGVSDEEAVW